MKIYTEERREDPVISQVSGLEREPNVGDMVHVMGRCKVERKVPPETPHDYATLFLLSSPAPVIDVESIQTALATLIRLNGISEMTCRQFIEGMRAWERCLKTEPQGDYSAERLVEIAISHC